MTIPPSSNPTHFFSNPIIGFASLLVGIIGILLAIYFYTEGKEYRNLTYYIHPVKATILHSEENPNLKVSYDNQVIPKDITAVQVAIWNSGKLPIRDVNILEPIQIYTTPPVRILEAHFRVATRPNITRIALQTEDLKNGQATIKWKILEHNDGAAIQLIYVGDSNVEINLKGTIEGQRPIEQLKMITKVKSPEEEYKEEVHNLKKDRYYILILGLFLAVMYYFTPRPRSFVSRLLFIILLFLVLGSIILMFTAQVVEPPFSF